MLLYSKENLFRIVQHYYNQKDTEQSRFIDKICTELDIFRNNVKNSEFGFHPKSQNLTKERNEDYENIIKADASMIFYADEISKISSNLELKVLNNDEFQPDLLNILNYLRTLKEIFQKRKDYITGVAQILEIRESKDIKNFK